jgi:hypothetical protein
LNACRLASSLFLPRLLLCIQRILVLVVLGHRSIVLSR